MSIPSLSRDGGAAAPFPAPLALILAAGLGTRMRSDLAKVLHPLCGRPMLAWAVAAAREAGLEPALVLHHQEDRVRALFPHVRAVRQVSPRGTGDAVRSAVDLLPPGGRVVVMPGDAPLVQGSILAALVGSHGDALCTVLSMRLPDPAAFGRIVRDGSRVVRIVEASEATAQELAIQEVNSGIYCFDADWLRLEVLPHLQPHPPKGEYYLTDAVEAAARVGRLRAWCHDDATSLLGINDRWALSQAEEVLQERILERHGLAGVTFQRPSTVRVEADVVLEPDVLVGPGAVLRGQTRVGRGATIGPYAILEDTVVGAGCQVRAHTVCESAVLEPGSEVGPFARLRQGTQVGPRARIGNFVETKKAVLGEGVKANHLTYLGDVEVGAGTNVGAGTITCNYDGYDKHPTRIGRDVFIGSDTCLVAPVSVGDGALVGAGSVIVKDVPPGALAVARGEQVTRPESGTRLRRVLAEKARLRKARTSG